MPFESIVGPRVRNAVIDENSITATIQASGRICFFIPGKVLSKMGWNIGEQVEVLEGSGSDSGHVCLQKGNAKGFLIIPRNKDKSSDGIVRPLISHFKLHHISLTSYDGPVTCTTQAFGGRIVFVVPSWMEPKS